MGRSGGTGGRSSGGFGGGRSSGGFRGSSRSSRPSGSYSRPTGSGMYRHRTIPRTSYSRPIMMGPAYGTRRGGSGTLISVILIILFSFMMVFSIFAGSGNSTNKVVNTTQREALVSQVQKTDWYEDQLYWIKNKNVMIEGLEHFYDKTGVQPYILFVAYDGEYWSNGTLNTDKVNDYLNDYYDNHFNDEGHFLFAYFQSYNDSMSEMEGEFRYLSGYSVDSIMDNEALSIFWGNFEDCYYNLDYSIEEMISNAFSDTADTIMSKPTNVWDVVKIGVVVLGGVGAVYLIYRMIKVKAKREKEKEEYTKEILDKPLETFGTDTSELEEKYK